MTAAVDFPALLEQDASAWSSDGPRLAALADLAAAHRAMSREQRRELGRVIIGGFQQFLVADRETSLGFPSAYDLDVTDVLPVFAHVLNNIGDPVPAGSAFGAHTKTFEREVVSFFARLVGSKPDDVWGYVTSGSAEAIAWALLQARTLHPDGVIFHSDQAHFSVPTWARALAMPAVSVGTDDRGVLNLAELAEAVARPPGGKRCVPIVVATVGTTMTEAVDDVGAIAEVLDAAGVRRRYIHADAALSGLPLALLPPGERPGFTLNDGADSISVSGHKFLGSPVPAGVVLTRREHIDTAAGNVDYVGTTTRNLLSSRSGHGPLLLWHALLIAGEDGLRARAERARQTAAYAVDRLAAIGWQAWRHQHAITVVLDRPADEVVQKWRLASSGPISHLVCMPRVTRDHINALCIDIANAYATGGRYP